MEVDIKDNGTIEIEAETIFERRWMDKTFTELDGQKLWLEFSRDSFQARLILRPMEEPPSFTREEISKMSLDEFLKNESKINEALKANRVK